MTGIGIDLAALGGLFFEASQNWTEPKVAVCSDLENDIAEVPAVKDLRAKGHKLEWARADAMWKLKRDGWKPVAERDLIGRPTIFMDRLKKLILLQRPPDRS